jgi:fatty acid hydroxylase domain-containing protein 2
VKFWNFVIDLTGENTFNVYVIATLIYSTCVYWILGVIYTLMDLTLKPKSLRKFKVQIGANEPVDKIKLWNAIKVVLFNQFVMGGLTSILPWYFRRFFVLVDLRAIPSFSKVIIDLIVCIFFEEVLFYYTHRMFHSRFFYTRFHKQHHEWKSPIAITAIYCHPIEQLVCNLFPVMFGTFLMKSHLSFVWLWFTIVICTTM